MNRILVPLDGSLRAEEALPTAVALARRHACTIDLLLVNEARPGDGLEVLPWAISTTRTRGEYIALRARRLGEATDCFVVHSVADGRAADEICRHAAATGADLIVMTGRGRTGLARVLGGSVADVVIRHARIPVLMLRASAPGRRVHTGALRMERILIAVDGSAESVAALNAATALADPGATELDLVEVVTPVHLSPLNVVRRIARIDRMATQHAVERAHERLAALARSVAAESGCDVYSHVAVKDDVARGILRVARGFNASIIAMGTHGRGASRMVVGSVAERVLGSDRYPMLIVRAPDAAASTDQHSEEDVCVPQPHL